MEVKAIHRGARISAQKTRLVADQIRGLSIERALNVLTFSPKKAAGIVKKVVESAIANAEHNEGADIDELHAGIPGRQKDAIIGDPGAALHDRGKGLKFIRNSCVRADAANVATTLWIIGETRCASMRSTGWPRRYC